MSKWLLVGDPHVRVEDLEDCRVLMQYVVKVAIEQGVDSVLFLGDQFHHHAVLHVQVVQFWRNVLENMQLKGLNPTCLVGNHDLAGTGDPDCHAMLALSGLVDYYAHPDTKNGILLHPYCGDAAMFIRNCRESDGPTVICHETFVGSQFENGFYAKDGIDTTQIPQKTIISGHIHAPQLFGKTWYVGSPRWLSFSDANQDRAIWVVTFDDAGNLVDRKPFSTNHVCRRILHFIDTPDKPLPLVKFENAKVTIDIKGPADWIAQRKTQLASMGRIRTFPTDTKAIVVKESDGIWVAFRKWTDAYCPQHGGNVGAIRSLVIQGLERGSDVAAQTN